MPVWRSLLKLPKPWIYSKRVPAVEGSMLRRVMKKLKISHS